MFSYQGITVNSWVNVDASCRMESEVVGEELQIEFQQGVLGIVITEDALDKLVEILTAGKEEFRRLGAPATDDEMADDEPGDERAVPAGQHVA